MGIFSKILGNKDKVDTAPKGLKELSEIELKDGEFTLSEKLWNHLTRYKLRTSDDILWLNGDNYFKTKDVSQIINELTAQFGVDGHGDGNWTNQDNEDLVTFGSISRNWYLDENNNGKPAEWVNDESNNYDFARLIRIDCDKEDSEVGVELQFTGWSKIKEYLNK